LFVCGQGVDERASKQVIGTLLTEVEAQLGTVQVVLAGYPDPMQKLMRTDPGLQSRFPTRIHIDDYTIIELCEIAKRYAATKGVRFHKRLPKKLEKYVEYLIDEGLNARDMERRTDAALAKRTNRLFLARSVTAVTVAADSRSVSLNKHKSISEMKISPNTLELTADDFGIGGELGESKEKKDLIDQELDKLVGMQDGKEMFQQYKDIVLAVESGIQSRQALKVCMNLIITGNPGTGKVQNKYINIIFSKFFFFLFHPIFLNS